MTVPIKYLTCRFFQMDKNDVVKKILESKKYENLDSDIVEKVVSISEKKYKL
ncbi:16S rRNA (guanine(1405)-N(7))-methyltransferase ArmA, partial [Acinetobacter baumannii]